MPLASGGRPRGATFWLVEAEVPGAEIHIPDACRSTCRCDARAGPYVEHSWHNLSRPGSTLYHKAALPCIAWRARTGSAPVHTVATAAVTSRCRSQPASEASEGAFAWRRITAGAAVKPPARTGVHYRSARTTRPAPGGGVSITARGATASAGPAVDASAGARQRRSAPSCVTLTRVSSTVKILDSHPGAALPPPPRAALTDGA